MHELTDTQGFIFLHPKDNQLAWDGNEGWTGQIEDWWKTKDLQEFGQKQLEIAAQGLAYRTVIMDLVPVQLVEGLLAGKWALEIKFLEANIQMQEDK